MSNVCFGLLFKGSCTEINATFDSHRVLHFPWQIRMAACSVTEYFSEKCNNFDWEKPCGIIRCKFTYALCVTINCFTVFKYDVMVWKINPYIPKQILC